MPIIEKNCVICCKPFQCWERPTREQVTCGRICAGRLRTLSAPDRPKKPPNMVDRVCERCGKTYPLPAGRKPTRFCGKSCSCKNRWESDAFRAKMSPVMSRKSEKQRAVSSARMRRLNATPEMQELRMRNAERLKGQPFVAERGGNGKGMTKPQAALFHALGSPWKSEFHVKTGNPSWHAAAIDIAHPTLKIAIEVDGNAHLAKVQMARDSLKDSMLADLGWIVLRFKNRRVDSDLTAVLSEIAAVVESRASSMSR